MNSQNNGAKKPALKLTVKVLDKKISTDRWGGGDHCGQALAALNPAIAAY